MVSFLLGEKPYECPNCKKRFSHSGSYSSHISSKKCIGVIPVNGRARSGLKTPQCSSPSLSASPGSPVRTPIRQKIENKPLQEQLPVNQIKTEPVDYEIKPIVLTSGINYSTPLPNGVFSGGIPLQATSSPQGVVQAVVLPTMGLVSPISINLSDIQNVLKMAVDGNVIRQVLENNHANLTSKEEGTITSATLQQAGHSVISAFSLPLVDQDGTTKIIINYSLEPSQLPVVPQNLKKEVPVEVCKTEKCPEDLTIKTEKDTKFTEENTCMLSEDPPTNSNALQEPKHYDQKSSTPRPESSKAEPKHYDQKNSTPRPESSKAESMKCDSSTAETTEGNPVPSQPPLKNLQSLLKAYFALNAQPSADELSKIADSVNLPLDVVKKWFEKMQNGEISLESSRSSSPKDDQNDIIPENNTEQKEDRSVQNDDNSLQNSSKKEPSQPLAADGSDSGAPSPSPLNLSSLKNSDSDGATISDEVQGDQEHQMEPLDLSLPKQLGNGLERPSITSVYQSGVYSVQEEPLNLSCVKKEPMQVDSVTISEPALILSPSANPINISIPTVTAQLPTIVAITDQNSVPCLRALTANKQTILIPQVTYTYATTSTATVLEPQQKSLQANGNQVTRNALCFASDKRNVICSYVNVLYFERLEALVNKTTGFA